MKKIYILLSHTGTVLSNLIKYYTKDEFSHVSISLDKELTKMYSFGRLNPYNPFKAGFVHEEINRGTFKRFFNTKSALYELKIEDEQYKNIENIISKFKKENYKFNILGLILVGLNKKINMKHSFYCAEFVKYVLEESNVKLDLPVLIRPESFKQLKELKLIYKGYLRKYQDKKNLKLNHDFSFIGRKSIKV